MRMSVLIMLMMETIVITTRLVKTYLEASDVHVMRDMRATEPSVEVSSASAVLFRRLNAKTTRLIADGAREPAI